MNLKEYIVSNYDVRGKIADLKRNPIAELIAGDDFPYDIISMEDGEIKKMLFYPDGVNTISVLDLISYYRSDIVKMNDKDLLTLYDSYMELIDIEKLDLLDPVRLKEIRESSLNEKSKYIE